MRHRRIAVVSVGATLLLGLLGCGGSSGGEPPGSIRVRWDVPVGCQTAGIDRVRVWVREAGSPPDTPPTLQQTATCGDGSLTLDGVPAGTWELFVDGLDPTGHPTHGASTEVDVAGGETSSPPPLTLVRKPSALDISWRFADGGLCSSHGVHTVAIHVFDETGGERGPQVLRDGIDCDPFATLGPDERVFGALADPTYTPKGIVVGDLDPGAYAVRIFGLDESGERTVKGQVQAHTGIGDITAVEVVLVPCDDPSVEVPCQ